MNASTVMLRGVAIVGFAISLLVAIASCIGLAASFVKPALDLQELYRISSLTRKGSFLFLGGYLIVGFVIPNPPAAGVSVKKASSWEQRVLMIIGIVCFLLIMFSPYTYVYPEAGGWITKSKAGTFSILSDVAREYLWRDVRTSSAIPLCLSLSAIALIRQFARQTPQ
jgi:hypothetical protein